MPMIKKNEVSTIYFLLFFVASVFVYNFYPLLTGLLAAEVIITAALVTAYVELTRYDAFSSLDSLLGDRISTLEKTLSQNLEEKKKNLVVQDLRNQSLSGALLALPNIVGSSVSTVGVPSSGITVERILSSVYIEEKASAHSIYSAIGITGTAKRSSFPVLSRTEPFLMGLMEDLENGTR